MSQQEEANQWEKNSSETLPVAYEIHVWERKLTNEQEEVTCRAMGLEKSAGLVRPVLHTVV